MTFPNTTFTQGTTITSTWLNAVNDACLGSTLNVFSFGAVGDGVTDDTAAIQAAIAEAKSVKGGLIYFPPGDYKITSTILIDDDNIFLQGAGGGGYKAGIAAIRDSAATRIMWAGDTTSPMVLFETPNGVGGKSRGGLASLLLDCQNKAKYGLQITSWSLATFENLTVYGAVTTQIYLSTKVAGTLSAEPYDCYRNYFRNVFTTCKNLTNSSKALVLGAGADGGAANSCYNMFEHCYFTSSPNLATNASNISLQNTDNNILFHCQVGKLFFQSSDQDVSGNNGASRYNWVIACEGNISAVASTLGGTSSFGNNVIGLNNSNGTGIVTVGDGAQLNASDMFGFVTKQKFEKGFVSGNIDPENQTQQIVVATNDLNKTGSVWLRTSLSSAPSPYFRVTGGRNDANTSSQFAGKIALDAYRTDDPIPTNKALGSIFFGGSVVPNSYDRDDTVYAAAIMGRSAGVYNSSSDCPTDLYFYSESNGETMNNFTGTPKFKVRHTGAVQFPPLASDPATAEEGDVYFNSVSHKLRFYNGSAWADV